MIRHSPPAQQCFEADREVPCQRAPFTMAVTHNHAEHRTTLLPRLPRYTLYTDLLDVEGGLSVGGSLLGDVLLAHGVSLVCVCARACLVCLCGTPTHEI